MYYRPEIDGLRAFAILPVIFFHAGFSVFSGGYLGVDIFFVISGYLITSILINNAENNKLSILKFYEKRARRILPALFLVLFFTSAFYPLFNSHPLDLEEYGISILAVLSFISNIYFWTESGYFGSASEMTPLLHTWSLAVEEQYYLFLPLMILFLYKSYRRFFIISIFLLIIVSLLIAEWGAKNSAEGNFYLLPSRLWELFTGSLCALYYNNIHNSKLHENHGAIISNASLALLVICIFIFTPSTLHPSALTLVPVFAVACIILFSSSDSFSKKVLTNKALIWIGLLSYSIYLWHQPILVFMRLTFSDDLPLSTAVLGLAFTILLSWVSWKYIEAPYRDQKRISNTQLIAHMATSTLLLIIIALAFLNNKTIQRYIDSTSMDRYAVIEMATNNEDYRPKNNGCRLWAPTFSQSFINAYDRCSEKHGKSIFILGGSHGMDMYNVASYASSNPFVVSVSRGFCRIHQPLSGRRPHKCQYQDFVQFVEKRSQSIGTLIYTQTGDRLSLNGLRSTNDLQISQDAIDQIINYLSEIKVNHNINVVIVGSLPTLTFGPKKLNYQMPLQPQFTDMYSPELYNVAEVIDKSIRISAEKAGIQFVSKIELLKMKLPEDLLIDGKLTYSDNRHLSRHGAIVFGKRAADHEIFN